MNQFLLYGANGYTGELIARYAKDFGLEPILAGRNQSAIEPIAQRLGLSFVIFDLKDETALLEALKKVKLVVHAAGPFQFTAQQMIEACLKTGVHYVDINGDVSVFEMIKQYDERAKTANVQLLPGAGFDVVPTDSVAVQLKNLLPDADLLEIAFASTGGGISHGTAMTMASRIGEQAYWRKDHQLVKIPMGKKGKWIDFYLGREKSLKKLFVMNIQWGDISTAHFSTGIPNIITYTGIQPKIYRLLKWQVLFNWLLRTEWIRGIIRKKIAARPAGPSDEQRAKARSLIWGQATDKSGKKRTIRLSGPEGYTLTTLAVLTIVKKILGGQYKAGYQTPASVYGENLIMEIDSVERIVD